MRDRLVLCLTALLLGGVFTGSAEAVATTFTDRLSFNTAVFNLDNPRLRTFNFDTLATGTVIANGDFLVEGGGFLEFHYPVLASFGVSLQVRSDAPTTSGKNYLGTTDAGVFQDGDDFSIDFSPVNGIGMFFLTRDELLDGDIRLSVFAGPTASLDSAAIERILGDGTRVYFLRVLDPDAFFVHAQISTSHDGAGGFFFWNVDNVAQGFSILPAPTSLALMAVGLAALALAVRRS
jgi:hypothetical protein